MRSYLGLVARGSIAILSALLVACSGGTPTATPDTQTNMEDATVADDVDVNEATDAGEAAMNTGDDGFWHDPNTLPDGAANPCLGATTCSECTDRTPCAWCNGACLAGTAEGSFDGTCRGDQWLWRGVQCPGSGTQCAAHTDCITCAQDPDSCGWCSNTGHCMGGDRNGPATAVPGCSPAAMTWVYNLDTSTCP